MTSEIHHRGYLALTDSNCSPSDLLNFRLIPLTISHVHVQRPGLSPHVPVADSSICLYPMSRVRANDGPGDEGQACPLPRGHFRFWQLPESVFLTASCPLCSSYTHFYSLRCSSLLIILATISWFFVLVPPATFYYAV